VLRVHQVEQCPHGAFRGTFVGPDDDLGREHVDPAQFRQPRRGDPVESPDGDEIDEMFPLIRRSQRERRVLRPTAVHDEPVRDNVEQAIRIRTGEKGPEPVQHAERAMGGH